MRITARKIHRYWLLLGLLLAYSLHFPFFWIFSRSPRTYPLLNMARKSSARMFMYLAGIFFEVRFEEPLDRKTAYVFCPNHTSYLDIPLMCQVARGSYAFMGKEELLSSPLFRLFFKTIDIPVKRESKLASYRAFCRASDYLREGTSIILFPEGTVSDRPPALLPFKRGAFRLAIENQLPLVPVTIANAWEILEDKGQEKGSRPGIIRIFVHKALPTAGMCPEDEDKLMEEVYGVIGNKLSEYARK